MLIASVFLSESCNSCGDILERHIRTATGPRGVMLHWREIDLAEVSRVTVGRCCKLTTSAQSACIEFLWWLLSGGATQDREGVWTCWLIAFTDRNPADHNAVGINSTALHCQTRPNPNTDWLHYTWPYIWTSRQLYRHSTRCTFLETQTSEEVANTHIHQGYVFVGWSWTRASRWPSEQTEQWLAPLPRCHQGQVQTLCWPAAPADTATRLSGVLWPGHGVDIF